MIGLAVDRDISILRDFIKGLLPCYYGQTQLTSYVKLPYLILVEVPQIDPAL